MKPVTFCVEYFEPADPQRRAEIQDVLRHNLGLDVFEKVMIFTDAQLPAFAKSSKVAVQRLDKRFEYSDFLKQAVDLHRVYLLANSDIQFETGVEYFQFVPRGELWALTRRERDGVLSVGGRQSQDVWATRGRDWGDGLVESCKIQLGWPGCENAFAGRIHEAGLSVKNYGPDISCVHIHSSSARNYGEKDRIQRPYYLPDPRRIPWAIRLMALFRKTGKQRTSQPVRER